jgi:hypothetical protein
MNLAFYFERDRTKFVGAVPANLARSRGHLLELDAIIGRATV